jgi:RNA methyltransferase, TrmH family
LVDGPRARRLTVSTQLGAHSPRLTAVRALKSVKGRREQRRFAFEGATLLQEARASGTPVEELYVTPAAYAATPLVLEAEAAGTPVFLVDDACAARISDLEAPSGILAVAPATVQPLTDLLAGDGCVLVLADLNDPGNAGSLLRSARAFGCRGVVFGRLGVDPYHPKVVRGAMGAVFALIPALADPRELDEAARLHGYTAIALQAGGEPLSELLWPARTMLLVGHEVRGLGGWEGVASRTVGIRMRPGTESLNAAIAGSIALYEAGKARRESLP